MLPVAAWAAVCTIRNQIRDLRRSATWRTHPSLDQCWYGRAMYFNMGYPYIWSGRTSDMKTTIEIPDPLFKAARQAARRDGTTLRALVEHGLRLALEERRQSPPIRLRDASVDGRGLQPGAETLSWEDLRRLAYGDREGSR